jgi:hypothetical protein
VKLLGSHVGHLAFELPVPRRLQAAHGARHAEVEQARHAVDADQDVLRRDVAVHDVEGLALFADRLVCGVEAVEHAGHDRHHHARVRGRHHPANGSQELREGLALHVLEDEEDLVVVRHDVERRNDVGVPDARGEASLVEEHRQELGILRVLWVQSLDRDGAREPGDATEAPEMHRGHAARSDLAEQQVSPDEPSWPRRVHSV